MSSSKTGCKWSGPMKSFTNVTPNKDIYQVSLQLLVINRVHLNPSNFNIGQFLNVKCKMSQLFNVRRQNGSLGSAHADP